MLKEKFTENEVYSQFFSFEVLDYFDSIGTKENVDWIVKYFDILMQDENKSSEKFEIHHIRPCCTFKDDKHKNRKQTQKLGDDFNGNTIKLSVYNHLFAHFYLWKIFNNKDLKITFQRMCGEGKYKDNLTEVELDEIARLREECKQRNWTDKEKREYSKQWYEDNKEEISEKSKKRYEKNKEKILKRNKTWKENNKEKRKEHGRIYRKNNKERISKRGKEWYEKNKEKKLKQGKERYEKNKKEILEKRKIRNHKKCIDPIKGDECTYQTLNARKHRNKEKYKGVIASKCIINDIEIFTSI